MKKIALLLIAALVILTAGFATGCANDASNVNQENTAGQNTVSNEAIDAYLASVKEQADAINTSLEQDELTQSEMNAKSLELAELWDGAMNYLLDELKNRLSEEEYSKLQDAQATWATEKDNTVNAAGAEYEGGPIYALIVNSEAARITEERVLELYEMLK